MQGQGNAPKGAGLRPLIVLRTSNSPGKCRSRFSSTSSRQTEGAPPGFEFLAAVIRYDVLGTVVATNRFGPGDDESKYNNQIHSHPTHPRERISHDYHSR
jgi:hypothetical protein